MKKDQYGFESLPSGNPDENGFVDMSQNNPDENGFIDVTSKGQSAVDIHRAQESNALREQPPVPPPFYDKVGVAQDWVGKNTPLRVPMLYADIAKIPVGMAMAIPQGLSLLADTAITGDPEKAQRLTAERMKWVTPEPHTPEGKLITKGAEAVMSVPLKIGNWVGEKVQDVSKGEFEYDPGRILINQYGENLERLPKELEKYKPAMMEQIRAYKNHGDIPATPGSVAPTWAATVVTGGLYSILPKTAGKAFKGFSTKIVSALKNSPEIARSEAVLQSFPPQLPPGAKTEAPIISGKGFRDQFDVADFANLMKRSDAVDILNETRIQSKKVSQFEIELAQKIISDRKTGELKNVNMDRILFDAKSKYPQQEGIVGNAPYDETIEYIKDFTELKRGAQKENLKWYQNFNPINFYNVETFAKRLAANEQIDLPNLTNNLKKAYNDLQEIVNETGRIPQTIGQGAGRNPPGPPIANRSVGESAGIGPTETTPRPPGAISTPPAAQTIKPIPLSEIPDLRKSNEPVKTTPSQLISNMAERANKKGVPIDISIPETATVSMEAVNRQVTEMYKTDPERVTRVAMGEEAPPQGTYIGNFFKVIEDNATKNGDTETLVALSKAPVAEISQEAGRTIKSFDYSAEGSPVKAMRDLRKARTESVQKRHGNVPIEKVKRNITNQIRAEIQKTVPKPKDWTGLVRSLQCPI